MTHLPAILCRGAGFEGSDAGLLLLAAHTVVTNTPNVEHVQFCQLKRTSFVVAINGDDDALGWTLSPDLCVV